VKRPRTFSARVPAGLTQLDRFYLCRNVRVNLQPCRLTSENRRVLRKGGGITAELVRRAEFDYTAARRQAWKAFADERFGRDVMTLERLDRLMSGPVISHVLRFVDEATGQSRVVLMFAQEPNWRITITRSTIWRIPPELGMFMMTRAVELFAQRGVAFLHLGTCYSMRALYKTQFAGCNSSMDSDGRRT